MKEGEGDDKETFCVICSYSLRINIRINQAQQQRWENRWDKQKGMVENLLTIISVKDVFQFSYLTPIK